jgi:YD repeat-containing protein
MNASGMLRPGALKRALLLSAVSLTALYGPTPAVAQAAPSPYTTGYRYDGMNRVVGVIMPDPDGAGTLAYGAVRNSYDAAGRLIKVEKGELASWQSDSVAPSAWTGFTVFESVETSWDVLDHKTQEQVRTGSAGAVFTLTQYDYDTLGRPSCAAVRMNPAVYGSLPGSACTLGTQGSAGPDRITKSVYDAAGELVQVRRAVATADEGADVTYSYTPNGGREYVIDANGNRAKLVADGFDRRVQWIFSATTRPGAYNDATQATALATAGSLNTGDFEQYGYDANGNRTALRKRDGLNFSYSYDALNRVTVKVVPERAGLSATNTRDVYYGYDAQGHQLWARFDSVSGEGISNNWDGLGRLQSTTQAIDGASRTISYLYDADGDRTRVTFPDGNYVAYSYDGLDRPLLVQRSGTATIASYGYNEYGVPGSANLGSFQYTAKRGFHRQRL